MLSMSLSVLEVFPAHQSYFQALFSPPEVSMQNFSSSYFKLSEIIGFYLLNNGLEQPGPVETLPARGMGWNWTSLKVSSTPPSFSSSVFEDGCHFLECFELLCFLMLLIL